MRYLGPLLTKPVFDALLAEAGVACTVAGDAADNDSGGNADDPRNGDTP